MVSYSVIKRTPKIKHERNMYRGRSNRTRTSKECSSCNKKLSVTNRRRMLHKAEDGESAQRFDEQNNSDSIDNPVSRQIKKRKIKLAERNDKQTGMLNIMDETRSSSENNKDDDRSSLMQKMLDWVKN